MPLLMADTVVHGELYDAEAVPVRAESIDPGGSGSGFWVVTHCSPLTVPDALSRAL